MASLKALILLIMLVFFGLSGSASADPAAPQADVELRQRLSQVTAQERAVMESLFRLSAEISLRETEIQKAQEAIAAQEGLIAAQQGLIDSSARRFEGLRASLGTLLRSQQRAGAGSRLETLLGAQSLKDLMRRINLLRDLTRSTDRLMTEVTASRKDLETRKQEMAQALAALQAQRQTLEEAHSRRLLARADLERYLAGLKTDKAGYEADLKLMEARWQSLKPLFAEAVSGVNRLIAAGGLPPDTVTVSVSLFGGTRGYIHQDRFNSALALEKNLPRMTFGFHPGKMTLDFPGYEITLSGHMALKDPQTLEFVVTSGTFYSLPLSDSALQDLFSRGDLVFSLRTMIGNTAIRRIELRDGLVELQIGSL